MKILIVFSHNEECHELYDVLLQDYQEENKLNGENEETDYLQISYGTLVCCCWVKLSVRDGWLWVWTGWGCQVLGIVHITVRFQIYFKKLNV